MSSSSKKRLITIGAALVMVAILAAALPWVLQRYSPLTLNVKDAGARGDGISDDTVAFQLTLKRANAHTGKRTTIVIPEGVYRLDPRQTLLLHEHIRLVGQNNPVLTFRPSSSARLSSPSGAAPGDSGYEAIAVAGSHVRIEGLVIDGNYRLIRGIGIHSGSRQVRIKDTLIRRMSQPEDPASPLYSAVVSGIMIYGGTRDIMIDSSTISDIQAIHNPPVARGIMVWNQPGEMPGRQIRITNNTISHIQPREDADGIFFDKTEPGAPLSNSIIEGNYIHHTGKRGIKIAAPGVTITNNHITNSYSGNNRYLFYPEDPLPQDMYSAISIYASYTIVSDNRIDGVGTYYAAIEVDGGPLRAITIEENIVSGGPSSADTASSTGIRLGELSGFTVKSNEISNMHTAFVLNDPGIFSRGLISDNWIKEAKIAIRYLQDTVPNQANP